MYYDPTFLATVLALFISPRTIVYIVFLVVLLVGLLYFKTLGKDRTPQLDKAAKLALAETWKADCSTNWRDPDCSCETCQDYLHPSPKRVRLFMDGWSLGEEVVKKDMHHQYQYKPNTARAQRFAAAFNEDPRCTVEIKGAIS